MIHTIQNRHLAVQVDDLGAQLCSVRSPDGTEYIWQADPAIWGRHAPLLFPVIGRLQDGQYTLDGQVFSIPIHGFARDSLFQVVNSSGSTLTFLLTDSPESRAVYPFSFSLAVTCALEENRLTKSFRVENHSPRDMYYELGGHEGYRAPLTSDQTMDDYAVLVPGLDVLTPYGMDPGNYMVTPKGASYPLEEGRIPLRPSAFHLDTIILDQLPARRAMLADRVGRPRVTVDFPDFPYLGLWTQASPRNTNFVCIEPWSTLPDAVFAGRSLADKPGIRTLVPNSSEVLSYTITFQ